MTTSSRPVAGWSRRHAWSTNGAIASSAEILSPNSRGPLCQTTLRRANRQRSARCDRRVGKAVVVRHDDERFLALPGQPEKQIHDGIARLGIEVAGRFIGENDVRIIRQGPGDRDPLLLASGKFRREMIQAIGQADRLRDFLRKLLSPVSTPDHSRKHDVLQRGQFREEKVALKNKTHLLIAQFGQRRFAAAIKFSSFKFNFARFRPLESGESVEQRGLPCARGATEENRLTMLHFRAKRRATPRSAFGRSGKSGVDRARQVVDGAWAASFANSRAVARAGASPDKGGSHFRRAHRRTKAAPTFVQKSRALWANASARRLHSERLR